MIELRIIFAILGFAVLAVGGYVVKGWYDDSKQLEVVAEAAQQADQSTGGLISEASSVVQESQRIDIVVTQTRQHALEQYNDLRDKDPEVAAYGRNPVPQRLRDLARARRLEREGLGGDGAGSANDVGASPAGRSNPVHGAGDQR